ncbi:hypothetical protein MAR_011853 [Mya arenaria]|uniref:Uncharacterized protein n=1 Tax=Mya arenaria TaxID=6604 RepID=A0ABY7FYZ0_MYAAR|nr:hypothetical protein MAR_011853 [Mya arenaria]
MEIVMQNIFQIGTTGAKRSMMHICLRNSTALRHSMQTYVPMRSFMKSYPRGGGMYMSALQTCRAGARADSQQTRSFWYMHSRNSLAAWRCKIHQLFHYSGLVPENCRITNSLLRLGVDNRRFRQQQCETFATIIQRRPSAYVAKNFRSSNLASTKMPKQQNISSAQFVCGSSNAANYVQRKYYTPKSISQQADETPSSDDEEDRKAEYDFRNVNSSFPEHSAMHIGVSCLSSAATIL